MSINKTNLLKTALNERIKTHTVFNLADLPIAIYEAPSDAVQGTPCLVTQYEYGGSSGVVIVNTQEIVGTWLSSYDGSY